MRGGIAIAALALAACDNLFNIGHVPTPATPDATNDTATDSVGEPGLIAHYTMDSLASDRLVDSVAGRDGGCVSCPTPIAAGRVDGGMVFNGTSNIVAVAPTTAFDTTSGLTVALWIRLETAPAGPLCLVNKRLGPNNLNTWQICAEPGHVVRASWYEGGDKSVNSVTIDEDTWHHVAMRWDGLQFSLSLDGVSGTGAPAQLSFDAGAVTIGGDIDGTTSSFFWDGALDDLRIYDRALSTAEVKALAMP